MEKITCPNCNIKFDIEGVLAQDIKAQLTEEFNNERIKLLQEQKVKEQNLLKNIQEFEIKKKKENEIFTERLIKAKKEQEDEIIKRLNEDYHLQLESQKRDLLESKQKIRTLQEKELELVKIQRNIDETLRAKDIELEKRINEERNIIRGQLQKSIFSSVELKLKEKDKKLEDQHKLIEELKRKSEQGSMQLQGEAQELAIEDYLKQEFPFDNIQEVKKGATGADTVQTVINQYQRECGKIVYESKRTKAFSKDWIDKLKSDQRRVQADVAVLVTQVLPKEMTRFGQISDVWICNFEEFKSLCFVLRTIVLKTAQVRASQENKGDKMEMLYGYLTSEEFKLQINGIVDGFQLMKSDLDREKNSMRSIWKRREKQLESVIANTIDMYGSIKGIAGASVPSIESLELPQDDDFEQLT